MTTNSDAVVAKTTRVLARQILTMRRKAASPREKASKRRFFKNEQRELRQRLMAILAAERESDPLIDDVTLAEIGISGEVPFPEQATDDEEAEQQLVLRQVNAASGKAKVGETGWKRRKTFNFEPSLAAMRRAGTLPKEEPVHRPTEDAVLADAGVIDGEGQENNGPVAVTEPAPDPNYVPNGRGVALAIQRQQAAGGEEKPKRVPWNKGVTGYRKNGRGSTGIQVTTVPLEAQRQPGQISALVAVEPAQGSLDTVTVADALVTLSEEQLCKLFTATIGGRLIVDHTSYGPVYRVNLASFTKILPLLLERL